MATCTDGTDFTGVGTYEIDDVDIIEPEAPDKKRRGRRMTCKTCKFMYKSEVKPDLSRTLTCREQSPQIIMIPTPAGIQVMSMFPTTTEENTCGKFSVALSLVA